MTHNNMLLTSTERMSQITQISNKLSWVQSVSEKTLCLTSLVGLFWWVPGHTLSLYIFEVMMPSLGYTFLRLCILEG